MTVAFDAIISSCKSLTADSFGADDLQNALDQNLPALNELLQRIETHACIEKHACEVLFENIKKHARIPLHNIDNTDVQISRSCFARFWHHMLNAAHKGKRMKPLLPYTSETIQLALLACSNCTIDMRIEGKPWAEARVTRSKPWAKVSKANCVQQEQLQAKCCLDLEPNAVLSMSLEQDQQDYDATTKLIPGLGICDIVGALGSQKANKMFTTLRAGVSVQGSEQNRINVVGASGTSALYRIQVTKAPRRYSCMCTLARCSAVSYIVLEICSSVWCVLSIVSMANGLLSFFSEPALFLCTFATGIFGWFGSWDDYEKRKSYTYTSIAACFGLLAYVSTTLGVTISNFVTYALHS
jgi:hypothetical protein